MIKLEDIKDPSFLKDLSIKELNILAARIREFIITNVSKTGGHLSANLGVIELTIALHYVFDSPHDKFIFDVGHQSYTHKILTGRAKDFSSLRMHNGLSGFIKKSESVHDVWEAGHASTSLSAATGFMEAKASGEDIGEIISIIGDGAFQSGLALSAINFAGSHSNEKQIIILNDNNMSISPNVGVFGKIFDNLRTKKSYDFFRRLTPNWLKKLFRKERAAIKSYFKGNTIINAFGMSYYGPIDGHNLKQLIKYFKYLKTVKRPVIIHIKTTKGKGYKFAEADNLGKWHGIGPFNIETGEALNEKNNGYISWSNAIGNLILSKAKENSKIKVITPAMVQGSGLNKFLEELPEQLIDVGITEEHSVVMASAMAENGLLPVVSIYSTFLQRAYDQVNHDVARSKADVLFLIDRAGIVGEDGDTHQGVFDLSFLLPLPNVIVTAPKDINEANDLINLALYNNNNPFFIRYPKGDIINSKLEPTNIIVGSWVEELTIENVNIIAYGPVVDEFKNIISKMNIKVGLINARFLKPVDLEILEKLKHKEVIIYEEVINTGSLSSIIYELNYKLNLDLKIKSYGINDIYVEQGNIDLIKKDLGLNIEEILKNIE